MVSANGMQVGVTPLNVADHYILVLNPVDASDSHRGISGKEFRFVFTAPSDWCACWSAGDRR